MKENIKDRAKGALKEAKGNTKVAVGRATGNARMETEGHAEKIKGKAQRKLGDVEKVIED